MDIEDPAALLAYLRGRGVLQASEEPEVRRLGGGVSNRTVLVKSSPPFVVKQALPKLRVAVDWYSSPERTHCEALGLEWLGRLAPAGTITPLVFEDRDEHIVAMAAVPEPHTNWKAALLKGELDMRKVEGFGSLLGTIHFNSWYQRETLAGIFDDRSVFETLRVEPYYRYSARQIPEAAKFIEGLIQETLAARFAIVHGDYSPKNILIHQDRLMLIDHEVIHFGDPSFDVGFSLTHLLSKAHHVAHCRKAFISAAHLYVRCYLDSISATPWREAAEPRAVRHTLGCLLARVAGRSPLEYLTLEERGKQLKVVLALIPEQPESLSGLVDAFYRRLD